MKEIIMYTDGACSGNPGKGGYGTVLMYGEHRKELSGGFVETTNNRMELLAVILGLEELRYPCKVQLYSDSKYVVDAVEKSWLVSWEAKQWTRGKNQPLLNVDLWKRLFLLLKKHEVSFHWVKGHANNLENERCDFLATQAILNRMLKIDENYSKNIK